MKKYLGKKAFDGYAFANIKYIKKAVAMTQRAYTTQEEEISIFTLARGKEIRNLDALFIETLNKVGKAKAAIFETHKLMAEDLDFEDLVKGFIIGGDVAEVAVEKAGQELAKTLSALDDEYMKARAKDAIEVSLSIRNIILGVDEQSNLTQDSIIVCDDLDSSLLMKFDKNKIKGLVLVNGNVNSHVSILARSLQIPTIVAVKDIVLDDSLNNKQAILNAVAGELYIEPDTETIHKYRDESEEYWKNLSELKSFIGKKTLTKDGKLFKLYANIAGSNEIPTILANDAEGVGLYRSEFIYLKAKDYPTEEQQFAIYKEAVEQMKGKEIIIRTFDIGADKKVAYFDLPPEDNPALGYRSIRICRNRPEMFKTQLKALYRASVFGTLSIMIPMIISKEEILFTKEMIKEVWEELDKANIPYKKDVKVGIMIETPAAAIISDQLAQLVDFFSIGTNDLSQYTLACDRLNSTLDKTFDSHHKAILRLIKMTVENAHKAGIVVGMCGELARDPKLLPLWVGIGIDELSCTSSYILDLRRRISEIDTTKIDIESFVK